MGMFDEVVCNYPLPRPSMQGHVFQTKSLDCILARHEITADGRLLVQTFEYELHMDDSAPFGFYLERRNEQRSDTSYHGDLYFYDFDGPKDSGALITFRARFTDGQLVSIIEAPEP
jgi:hypothetical protein